MKYKVNTFLFERVNRRHIVEYKYSNYRSKYFFLLQTDAHVALAKESSVATFKYGKDP